MQLFLVLFWLLFGVINYKIVSSDISKKTIPNILLILLGVLSAIGTITGVLPGYNLVFIASFAIALIIGFTLYSLGFLSAGDIKYILVLSLFIPNISIITFMVNISLITFIYLLVFFCYLYFIVGFFYKKEKTPYAKLLRNNISGDIVTRKNKNTSVKYGFIPKLLLIINIFLIIFICIRLLRLYIVENIPSSYIQNITPEQILIIIGILLGISVLLMRKVWAHIGQKYETKSTLINITGTLVLIVLLFSLLQYGYRTDYFGLIENLYTIMTVYIAIFLLIRGFIYLYKFSLIEMELLYIPPQDLKKGDIVSKDFITNFIIPILEHKGEKDKKNIKNLEVVRTIRNNLTSQQVKTLQDIYKNEKIEGGVGVLPTTAFSHFIFGGFLISILLGDYIIGTIVGFVLKFI